MIFFAVICMSFYEGGGDRYNGIKLKSPGFGDGWMVGCSFSELGGQQEMGLMFGWALRSLYKASRNHLVNQPRKKIRPYFFSKNKAVLLFLPC